MPEATESVATTETTKSVAATESVPTAKATMAAAEGSTAEGTMPTAEGAMTATKGPAPKRPTATGPATIERPAGAWAAAEGPVATPQPGLQRLDIRHAGHRNENGRHNHGDGRLRGRRNHGWRVHGMGRRHRRW